MTDHRELLRDDIRKYLSHCSPHMRERDWHKLLERVVAALAQPGEGMVRVPREPTHEQTQAAFNFLMDDEKQINATSGWWGTTEDVAKIKGVYNAMLASAPAAGEGKP